MDHRDDRGSKARAGRRSPRPRRIRSTPTQEVVQTIPAEHRGGVLEGLAEVERGEFADEAELQAFFRRYNP